MASQEYEISFQQGVDGYSGTVDTQLNQKKPDRDYSTKSEIEVEADSNGDKQVLLRFDDLFDPGGIPDGAQILSATLTLQTTGAGDGASIHQMLTSWSETSTWNSLAGGISADGVEALAAADVTTGPTSAGAGSFDVTSSVQAWASGADNNGWVFQALGESGWDFETSEGSIRPQLTIRYAIGTSGVNQAPTAVADVAQVAEGGSIAINVLANDSDDDGDTLNVTQVGSAANGVATINPNDTITYVPTAGFSGSDSFSYTISDGNGGTDSATVNVTVVADNTTAVIGGTVSGGITEDANPTTLATSGIATIVDPDAGEDSFQTASGTTTYGNFSIASNGSWTYSVANGQNAIQSLSEGQTLTDSFVITSLDGSASETVQIVITGVNDTPVAATDSVQVNQNNSTSINVLANDSDIDGDTLTVSQVGNPANGVATINPNNTITYTPTAGFSGSDSFNYTISDGKGGTNSTTVNVTVEPDAPAQEYEISFQQGVDGYSGTVDTQLNQKKPDRDYSTKSEIEVEADNSGSKQVLLRFDDLFDPNGIPDGAQILSATLTLQTTGAGDGASIHQMLTSWSETSTWNSLAGGISADGVEALAAADVTTGPTSAGAGSFDVTSSVQAWASGADNNGWVFQGLGQSGWDFETSEGSIRPQLTIRYALGTSGVNQAPTAVADVAQVAEGGSIAINVLANDSDDDGDTLNVTQVGSAANGVATINPNNTITYVPTAGFSGSDSFNYTVSDGNGGTDSATVNVTVVADNTTAVIGGTVSGGITEDANPTTLATSGIATIVDPDAGEDSFQTASGTTTYGNFSIASNGSWTYSAANGQNAIQSLSEGQTLTDSFVITSLDGSASETVQIVITGVNDTPVAATDSVQVNHNNSTTINVLANDSDIDGDTLTVSQVGNPANGVATINPNNTITYTPTAGFSGSDSFNYTVSDGKGGTDSTTVAINVSATLPSNSPESYIAVADGGSSRNLEHDNASKSFYHDGTWWGVLPSIEGDAWAVYQFSEAVPETGDLGGWTVSSDPLANSDHLADIAWDSTSETLYVLQFDTEQPYLFQLGYDQSSQTWATENFVNLSTTLDTGYWADNADLALGVDQQGNPLILGITSGSGSEKGLHVAYSTSSDLGSWDFTTVDSDTTSSGGTNGNSKADFVTFSQNGVDKVGIVYSQDGGDNTWSFTWHDASSNSSNYDSGWSTEVITSSVGIDDHVSAVSDGTTIYAAVKDGNNAVWLLKGQPGNWDDPIKVINGGVSRPVIVLDESKQEIYIMYMDQSEVYMKATSALNPQFDTSDAGVKVLEIAGSGRADDPQGPVHPVGDDTDGYFVVFAKNQSTDAVWYNDVDLSADLWTA